MVAAPLRSEDTLCLVLFPSKSSATLLNTKMGRRAETPGALDRAGREQRLRQGGMKPGTSRWLGMLLECKEKLGTVEARTAQEEVNLSL